jgi:peptidyl-prolyl cis-trans isomerase D
MKALVQTAQISYSHELVSDDKIKVSEEDLKKWHEENLYRFPQDNELRNIEYVIFEIKPSERDLQEIETEVREKYAQFVASETPQLFVNTLIDSRFDSSFFKQNELPAHIDTLLFNAPIGTFVEPFIDGDYWMFAKLLATETRPDSLHVNLCLLQMKGCKMLHAKKKRLNFLSTVHS